MCDLMAKMQAQIHVWEQADDDRVIFLKCYSMMTGNMLQTVSDNGFHDGVWVTELTHRFADYYFDALQGFENNGRPPVWTTTFETAQHKNVNVMQNLLLGINAHICYDLIFALVDSIHDEWKGLSEENRKHRYQDYCTVNDVIGMTVDAVQDEVVEAYSRFMIAVDYAFGRLDEWMIHTLIKRWRDQVWDQSMAYMSASPDERPALKQQYTEQAEQRSRAIQGQRGIRGILDLF